MARSRTNYIRTKGGLIILEKHWRLFSRNVIAGKTTLIVGPTGSGKTRLAIEVAESLGRGVDVFHFGGLTDSEAAFSGVTVLRNNETRFLRSRFADAAETPNRVLVLDEINRTPGSIQNAVLSLTDFQRSAALDVGDEQSARKIALHPSNAIIATANVGSVYCHAEPLDPALVGRMLVVRTEYPEDETPLLTERGLDKKTADDVIRVTRAVRREYAKHTIGATVTTRSLGEIAELIRDDFDFETAFETATGVLDLEELTALRAIVKASRSERVRR